MSNPLNNLTPEKSLLLFLNGCALAVLAAIDRGQFHDAVHRAATGMACAIILAIGHLVIRWLLERR